MKEIIANGDTLSATFNAIEHGQVGIHDDLTQRRRWEALERDRRAAEHARDRRNERARHVDQADDPTALAAVAMASPERIAEFRAELDRLDHAAIEALYEIDEELAAASERLTRIEENAHTVVDSTGAILRVYRDGNLVRDDDGRTMDSEFISADAISPERSDWASLSSARQNIADLTVERAEVLGFIDHLRDMADQAESDMVAESGLATMRDETWSIIPDRIRHQYHNRYPDHAQDDDPSADLFSAEELEGLNVTAVAATNEDLDSEPVKPDQTAPAAGVPMPGSM